MSGVSIPSGKRPSPEAVSVGVKIQEPLTFLDYWPKTGWKRLWGGMRGYEDAKDQQILLDLLAQNKLPADYYDSAILSRSSAFGRIICAYVGRNIVLKTYEAPMREATRMEWASRIAQNKDKKYSDAWVESANKRLNEGRKGGPKPPSSGAIEIKKIRILRNITLWAGYVKMREQIRAEIDPESALRTVRFVNRDPEIDRLPILDAQIGEVLLFHGTSKATMKKIAQTGFDPQFCVNKGTDSKPNYGALGARQGCILL